MVWAAIWAIVSGVGTLLGKVWEATTKVVDWFIRVLPKPLRFFLFLYFSLYLITLIMPVILGTGFECDTQANVYKINMVDLWYAQQYVDNMAMSCNVINQQDVATDVKFWDVFGMLKWFKEFFVTVKTTSDIYGAIQSGNLSAVQEQIDFCTRYNSFVSSNETISKDFALQEFGEKLEQKDYKQVVHIGCAKTKDNKTYLTLKFFDIDIFNFELWLLLGLMGIMVPFAFKWYNFVFKR
jgi:hypothetical protein